MTLVDAGIDEFFISLTADSAELHDSITEVPGSFDKTLLAIRNLGQFPECSSDDKHRHHETQLSMSATGCGTAEGYSQSGRDGLLELLADDRGRRSESSGVTFRSAAVPSFCNPSGS
jgi:hypothetical protein